MKTTPLFTEMEFGITAIDTEYLRPQMDASHLIVDDGRAAFVDTGTTLSVPNLLRSLALKGIDRDQVDYVFLTHIHLDHAGGAGALMQALPAATAVLHPRGAPHMISPERLVAGTVAVYGEQQFREHYGQIIPVEEDRVRIVEDGDKIVLGTRTLEFIHTPGHALHHYCIIDPASRGIFSGDTFGVSYRETDTARGEFILPTTTPVHFDPDAAHSSIDRLLSYDPKYVYLTHYSRVSRPHKLGQDLHRRLDEFVAIARRHAGADDRYEQIRSDMRDTLLRQLQEHGYSGGASGCDAVLAGDLDLNTQGLIVWLDRMAKRERHAS